MTINLDKGARINLSKTNPSLKKVRIGLGWDPNAFDTGAEFDLDASAFVCKNDASGNPKLIADEYLVFYGLPTKTSPDGAVHHSGDNRTGSGSGDDETITVDLTKINPLVDEISFIVTIYESTERKQNFGQVKNSYIAIYDDEAVPNSAPIAKYSLEDDFSTETAVQFGSLYKKDGSWLFKAVGSGYNKGLGDFVIVYGGNLAK